MKKLMVLGCLFFAFNSFAGINTKNITDSIEVSSFIDALETNRSFKCEKLSSSNVTPLKNKNYKIVFICSQVNQNGETMANHVQIEMIGALINSGFELSNINYSYPE